MFPKGLIHVPVLCFFQTDVGVYQMATTPTVLPGQTIQLQVQSNGPISTDFEGDTLTATFALPNGKTATIQVPVAGVPQFEIVSVTLVTTPVQTGSYARAIVAIKNVGKASGSTLVTGVTTYNGAQVGTWD